MFKVLMLAIVAFGVSCTGAAAQLQGMDQGPTPSGLSLELSTAHVTFMLGEPVVLGVKVINTGKEPRQVPKNLKPEFGMIQYEISRNGGAFERFTPWALKEQVDAYAMLAPDASLEDDADIFFDGRKWVFNQPGDYQVRARGRNLQSRALSFKVTAPGSTAEKAAADLLLANPEAGLFLVLRGGDHLEKGKSTLEQVAKSVPGTAIAAHANLSLGLNQLQSAPNFNSKTVRAPDPTAAAAFLQRVDTKLLPQEKTAQTMLGRASAFRQLGQEGAAREIEEKLPSTLAAQFPAVNLRDFQQRTVPNIKQQLQLQ
jgi:hypothetical protein